MDEPPAESFKRYFNWHCSFIKSPTYLDVRKNLHSTLLIFYTLWNFLIILVYFFSSILIKAFKADTTCINNNKIQTGQDARGCDGRKFYFAILQQNKEILKVEKQPPPCPALRNGHKETLLTPWGDSPTLEKSVHFFHASDPKQKICANCQALLCFFCAGNITREHLPYWEAS